MATSATPREKLDQIFQFLQRASRYWWLTVGLMVIGGGLSIMFAKSRPKVYRSSAVLYYQERIQTSLLQNRDVSSMNRNIGERYRELLLARSSLIEIIRDPEANPFPDIVEADGEDAAVEELRGSVDFRPRGANTFIIGYTDPDPDRAKLVTERLTTLLRNKAAEVKLDSAKATAKFAEQLRADAIEELRLRQRRLNEFLVQHTEFVLDNAVAGSSAEGASIRAARDNAAAPRTSSAPASILGALERQRARIKARIENPTAPPPPVETPRNRTRTPAQQAADARVAEVEREVAGAQRALEDAQSKYTDRHPTVLKAKENLAAAQTRLKSAKAAVPPDADAPPDPVAALPADPAVLQRELAEIERQIAAERARQRGAAASTGAGSGTDAAASAAATAASSVVKLEEDYQRLKLDVDEQKERVDSLADSAFRTQMEAQQRIAEQGESLSIVDPAFRPLQPTGKPKKQLVMVGVIVFTMLGTVLALALALLDDRIYRRRDLDALELVPVLATIPRARTRRRWLRFLRRSRAAA